eukprot:9372334-Heterocapsa_arctica.AAC.1
MWSQTSTPKLRVELLKLAGCTMGFPQMLVKASSCNIRARAGRLFWRGRMHKSALARHSER